MGRLCFTLLLCFTTLCCVNAVKFVYPLIDYGDAVNVSYDHRALLINGQRRLLISGSVHYPRSTPAMWPGILQRTKEAGIDVIETYVFWNLHETTPGKWDFSGNADVIKFIQLAHSYGLYVNLRIGPYVCAEWNYGGFPEWLRDLDGIVFRDYSEPFMSHMATFTRRIVDILRPFFASNGGPIILAQIENEYGWLEKKYGVNGTKYAEWAINFAQKLNVGVPWIMCAQDDIPQAINTCNGFYCDNWIAQHTQQFPTQPSFWTENWPGWFTHWGEPIPTRPVEDVAFAVARWFAKGGSFMNYYMWHGGTTFGRWVGGPWIITSYDYDVALDEYGYPNEPKYSHSKQLHDVLHQFEAVILGQDPPQPINLGPNQEAHVYTVGSQTIAFLSNIDSVNNATVKFQGNSYNLPKWSVTILGNGKVLYCTSVTTSQENIKAITPVSHLSDGAAVLSWWAEPAGVWDMNAPKATTPTEQLLVTHDKTDYLWYVTKVTVNNNKPNLNIPTVNDFVQVYVDGVFQGQSRSGSFNQQLSVGPGSHVIQILSMTMGLVNWGAHMEQWQRGIVGSVSLEGRDITSNGWVMQPGLLGEYYKVFTSAGSGIVPWKSDWNSRTNTPLTWFRYSFDLPDNAGNGPFALDLIGMNKGAVWVNGHHIGRYWLTLANSMSCTPCDYAGAYDDTKCRMKCGQPTQRYYHVPFDWLQPKNNLVVIFEELGALNPGSVQLVKRAGGTVCSMKREDWPREDTEVYVQCDPDTYITEVSFASYGTPTGQCGAFHTGTCNAADSVSVVQKLCLGRSSCAVPVDISVFGDPCPNTTKSLAIQVVCK